MTMHDLAVGARGPVTTLCAGPCIARPRRKALIQPRAVVGGRARCRATARSIVADSTRVAPGSGMYLAATAIDERRPARSRTASRRAALPRSTSAGSPAVRRGALGPPERAMREQAVRSRRRMPPPRRARCRLPDAQLHLNRGDLGWSDGRLQSVHRHVTETDGFNEPVAVSRCERANARRKWCARIRNVN